jgi:hypothetical protein
MKAALNQLELASGQTGRYNAGDASSDALGGEKGLFVFKAVAHLVNDALQRGGELTTMASTLAGMLSESVGSALEIADGATQFAVGYISDALDLVDYAKGVPMLLLWTADQVSGKRYLQTALDKISSEVIILVGLYMKVSNDIGTGTTGTTTTTGSTYTPRIDRPEFRVSSVAVNQGEPVIDPGPDTTPVRKSAVSPTIIVGGAVAVAAAILLVK